MFRNFSVQKCCKENTGTQKISKDYSEEYLRILKIMNIFHILAFLDQFKEQILMRVMRAPSAFN